MDRILDHAPMSRTPRRPAALAAVAMSTLLLLASTLFAPPSAHADTSSPTQSGTTLRVAMADGGIDTLNPFLALNNASWDVFDAIYPFLTTILPDGQPGPYLATSWKQSADGLTWTFTIKSGLKWSDGVPLTSADIAWTFNLIMSNATAGSENGSWFADFAAVTAPNPTTLVVKTKTPEANLLYVSTPFYSTPIVPEHIWAPHVANLQNYQNNSYPVVGYGPWVLTDSVVNQYVKFDANKDFFMGSPHFDHLIEVDYTNSDAYVAALKDGQLNYVNGLDPLQFKAVQSSKNIKTSLSTGNGWTAVELNPGAKTQSGTPIGDGNPALQNPQVRRAISLAINKQELLDKVVDGQGQVGAGYLAPAFPQLYWTPPAADLQNYDPAEANQILTAAGYRIGPNGVRIDPATGKPLDLRLGIHSGESDDATISTYLVGWLKDIGIEVTIDPMSMSDLNSDLGKGDWDMLMDGWTSAPDPTGLLSIQTCAALPTNGSNSGSTDAFYCNPAFDKLFAEQSTIFDQAQRAKVIDQMQQMLYDADTDLILYYQTVDIAYSADVTGLVTGTPASNGYYPAQTSFYSYLDAAPVAGPSASGGGTGLWIGLAAAVLVLGGLAFMMLRRRSGADDRE
jgi:peptide/nickel transport system substrate-binding protein